MNAFYIHILQEEGSAEDDDQMVAAASVVVADRNPTCSKTEFIFCCRNLISVFPVL
jgi:hypothetical protein